MARGYQDIATLVADFGPCLSSKLVKSLTERGGTVDAAKKRVSRAVQKGALLKTKGVSFPRGESFVYLKEHADSPIFVENLWNDLVQSGSVVAHCLHGIQARGGLITAGHFPGISGSPFRVKGQLSYERVLSFLKNYKLLDERRIEGLGSCLQLGPDLPFDVKSTPARLKARLLVEELTINHLNRWLARMGMIAFASGEVRTNSLQREFGQFYWDMTAPSYVHPLMSKSGSSDAKPGFFVADVMVSGQVQVQHVRGFLRKCEVIRSQKTQRPFLSMLIGEQFSRDAFDLIRKQGSMAVSIKNLLGEELAEALGSLMRLLTNTATTMQAGPEQIGTIFNTLSAIEGAASNLRGPLFELVVAHCVGREGGNVDVQRAIREPETNELTDIDVFRVKPSHDLTAYECKGHLGNVIVSLSEVEKWFKQTIRKTRAWLAKNEESYLNMRQRFEFWTTGTLHPDALKFLESQKSTVRKFEIDWKDGPAVLQYVSQTQAGKLDDVLREHYLKHPLVTVDRTVERRRRSQAQHDSVQASSPDNAPN